MKHFRIVSLAMLMGAVWADEGLTLKLSVQEQDRMGIACAPVTQRTFGESVPIVGQVVNAPGSTLTLKSVLAGRVERIEVSPGDAVVEGQLLLILHSHELLEMQGKYLHAYQEMKLAETRHASGEELYEVEAISRMEVEQRKLEALSARLALRQAEQELLDVGVSEDELAALRNDQISHAHLSIRTPAPGIVMSLDVRQFEWIEAFAPLVKIGHPDRVEVELQMPPDEAMRLQAGDSVTFFPVGDESRVTEGRVISRVPEVDPKTRTVTVRVAFEGKGSDLYPGTFVQGQMQTGTLRQAPAVPESAVSRMDMQDLVFVRRAPDVFEARAVTLGRHDATHFEVVDGVEVGETIAVKGAFFFKSMMVKEGGEDE